MESPESSDSPGIGELCRRCRGTHGPLLPTRRRMWRGTETLRLHPGLRGLGELVIYHRRMLRRSMRLRHLLRCRRRMLRNRTIFLPSPGHMMVTATFARFGRTCSLASRGLNIRSPMITDLSEPNLCSDDLYECSVTPLPQFEPCWVHQNVPAYQADISF